MTSSRSGLYFALSVTPRYLLFSLLSFHLLRALTHANYAPSGNRVPFLSPSLFFSKRADDRWECRRPSLWKTTRLNIGVRNPFQDAPTLVRSSRLEASIQVQGPIRLGCPRSADRYYDH